MWPFTKKPTVEELNDSNIGNVLRKLGAVTEEELQVAITAQRCADPPKMLGQILIDSGQITPATLQSALDVQRKMRTSSRREAILSLAESQTDLAQSRIMDFRQVMARAKS